MHLYGLHDAKVLSFLAKVRAVIDGRKPQNWPYLYKAIALFHPRASLTSVGLGTPGKLYTEVSHHTAPALGWKDFSADEVPSADDPRMRWILRLMVLETSRHLLAGTDARFNATFCIWLPEQNVIEGPDEQEAFEAYRDRLFYSREPIPEPLEILETNAHRAYLSPTHVRVFVELERRTRFLAKVAARLLEESRGAIVARELLRMKHYFELIAAEDGSLFYCEDKT